MKNINILSILIIILLYSNYTFSQSLFELSDYDLSHEIPEKHTLFYTINNEFLENIVTQEINSVELNLPFFHNKNISLSIRQFNINNNMELTRHTNEGKLVEHYTTAMKTYEIKNTDSYDMSGVFIFSKKGVKAVITINKETYQIDKFHRGGSSLEEYYFITNVDHQPFEFNCANNLLHTTDDNLDWGRYGKSSINGCIELAIEIDYYTFQTFENAEEAVDWALEMIAVTHVLYSNQIGVGLKSNSAQIWEFSDPHALFIEDPKNMLTSMRDTWVEDENLSSINRHIVHLFSKRNDTGTGGIAFLNGVGSLWNGYGFSSNLTDSEDYVDLPAPYFFWNIYCLSHELGHNFGAKHTQWCGWPEGPIDNCADIEEMSAGQCSGYINNNTPQIGTIMSYCHTWPNQSGGGIIMEFHDYVKTAINAYLSNKNLDDCDYNETEGCMDELACNYNLAAVVDNSQCIYAISGMDCFGNCLVDIDNDGICDSEDDLYIFDIHNHSSDIIYPNPSCGYINLKVDNAYYHIKELKIINEIGQEVWCNKNLDIASMIDISSLPSGFYSAYLISESEIIKNNIIIQ